jgi:hypothetical protein
MAEQLTIFDVWEAVVREPLPRPEPRPEPDAPTPVPVLPGQQSLLVGVHLGEAEVDRALSTFDAAALRAVAERTRARYPHSPAVADWPRWADGLDASTAGSPRARLEAAEALNSPAVALARFPEMSPERFGALFTALLLAATEAVLSDEGPAARAADGTLLVEMLLRWQRADRARFHLARASETAADSGALRVARARCEAALGGSPALVRRCWIEAALVDADAVAADAALAPELADLLEVAADLALDGEPGDWLPALADLSGLCPLPAIDVAPDVGDPPGRRFAQALAHLRALRRRNAPDAETRPVKARLLAAAPPLKDRLRSV